MRKERIVLKNRIHITLIRWHPIDLLAIQANDAAIRLFKTGNQAQAGGFSRARRAQHGKKLSPADKKGNPTNSPNTSIMPGDDREFNGGISRGVPVARMGPMHECYSATTHDGDVIGGPFAVGYA